MKLRLINGYPFPYPTNLSEAEQDELSTEAPGKAHDIDGVIHFEWKDTLTIEFATYEPAKAIRELAGWGWWDERRNVVEAHTSKDDGYDSHPAIIVGDTAYCGFILLPE